MTIQQCKYVLEIAKTGSFSEAAKQLFIAQSSLSISVKTLEQELDIKIFERSGNGVYLTEEGAEFVRYARQICDSNDFVMKRYNSQTAQKKLNIATQHYDFIADIFGVFLNSTEDNSYKFAIKEIETHNVIREVETAYSDIGIIAIKDGDYEIMKRYLNKKKLSFTSFLKVSPHVFFRKGHPLSNTEKLNITHPCVPIMLYDEKLAVQYAKKMMEKGVYVVAFSYPVVPKGRARIRTQVCASHTKEDIDFVIQCLKESRDEIESLTP